MQHFFGGAAGGAAGGFGGGNIFGSAAFMMDTPLRLTFMVRTCVVQRAAPLSVAYPPPPRVSASTFKASLYRTVLRPHGWPCSREGFHNKLQECSFNNCVFPP